MKILTLEILRVLIRLFCQSTESQREFMKKMRQGVNYKLSITMNLIVPPLVYRKNGFGVIFFPQTTSYVKENEKKIHTYGKRKNAYFQVETASGSWKP